MSKNLEELIYEETKKRLDIMESKEYKFPEKISKTDSYIIISIITLSLLLIVLCMVEVIK
jgi:hypothetical protein